MPRSLDIEQLAKETATPRGLIERLASIGVVKPDDEGCYGGGDIIRIEAVQSFLDAGLTIDQLALGLEEGLFTFEFLDRFYPEPAPRTSRSYAEFAGALGERSRLLPGVYAAMGLPEPPLEARMRSDEEELLSSFFRIWEVAGDDETFLRAARLVGEPARLAAEGWTSLYVEKMTPALDVMPIEERIGTIVETTERAAALAPRLLVWLLHRHLRHAIDEANVVGLERQLSEHGLSLPRPERLPAVAFVDIAGYTRLTEEQGDELAARIAILLRARAEQVVSQRGGTVVKLLGDGVMLHFPEAADAAPAVIELLAALAADGLDAHAGVTAGPLLARDGDFYGSTANLASRLAGVANPGEVVVTDAVMDVSEGLAGEPLEPVALKGIDRPVKAHLLRLPLP